MSQRNPQTRKPAQTIRELNRELAETNRNLYAINNGLRRELNETRDALAWFIMQQTGKDECEVVQEYFSPRYTAPDYKTVRGMMSAA